MTQTEPTSGLWTAEANGACYNVRSPDRVDHFMMLVGMTHNNPGEFDANVADLIACQNACVGIDPSALSDLLEACERSLIEFKAMQASDESIQQRLIDQVEAAIAKATGVKNR